MTKPKRDKAESVAEKLLVLFGEHENDLTNDEFFDVILDFTGNAAEALVGAYAPDDQPTVRASIAESLMLLAQDLAAPGSMTALPPAPSKPVNN
jgi:hypothetical protein